ncbi:MAG TPA: hypothetical protein VLT81_18675, partial [Chondromyces sp.]|nr:hypothetical protein [Chondromyces sp.]
MRRFFRTSLVAIAVILTAGSVVASGAPPLAPLVPLHHASEIEAKHLVLDRAMRAKSWAPEPTPSPIDALHYDLSLHLDTDRRQLSGSVTVRLAAVEDGLTTVELDVDGGLRVVS